MKLHFDRALVEQMLTHAEQADEHLATFGQTGKPVASLLLVGDDGVYVMSSGRPAQPGAGGKPILVCYARECNPETMAFDAWWAVKRQSFGGDDGVESFRAVDVRLALATYPPGAKALILDVSPSAVGLVAYRTVIRAKAPPPQSRALPRAREKRQLKPN